MDIQKQLDISRELLESLQSLVNSFEKLSNATQSQSQVMSSLEASLKKSKQHSDESVAKSQKMQKDLQEAAGQKEAENFKKTSKNTSEEIKRSSQESEKSQKKRSAFFNLNETMLKNLKTVSQKTFNKIKSSKAISSALSKASKLLDNFPKIISIAKKGLYLLNLGLKGVIMIKEGIMTGGLSLLKDIPSMLLSLSQVATQVVTAMIGNALKFFTAITALPFTIAKLASSMGFKIREMVTEIGNAGEEAKETFDMTSDIGQGAVKLTGMAKGMLKSFHSPRSRLSKLFGMGAAAAGAFLKETFKIVENMGHYGEIFGQSILGSTKGAQYMIEMQKSMQLSGEELAYFAMEAYNSGKHPYDVLHETSQTIKAAADDNDLDFVALNQGFKKLRTNITDFGHLSSNEITKLTVKLRKMRVSTDDAVSVFKKFTSLEEASKASAMLFQSFNMNIDAFDLLTSRDPGEMLSQFREAMLATGKSFKDLDRHEKALLQSTTGISEQGLSAMMNHMNNGLSYKEAKAKIEEQDPTKEQSKMIESLSSTIKMFHKTLQFKSPFDAFFKGLTNNATNQKGLMKGMMDLSRIYEDIYHLGFSLNMNELSGMLTPINNVLSKIHLALTGQEFKNALKSTTIAVGSVFNDVAYDLKKTKVGKSFHSFENRVKKATKLLGTNNKDVLKKANQAAFDTVKKHLDFTNPLKSGPKAILLEDLKRKGMLKKIGKSGYDFVEGQSIKKAAYFMSELSDKYKNNPAVLKELKALNVQMIDKYDTELAKSGGKVLEILYDPSTNRETVKGRINHLYDVFSKAFDDGKNSFKMIFGIGSNLMGSIIRGMMLGIASALRLFAGSADATAEMLGLKMPKGLQGQTILGSLGIKKGEYNEMSEAFSKESTKLVKELPTFISLTSSFIGDLTEIFADIALGIAGFAGNAMYEVYKNYDNVTGGSLIQGAMRAAGFNVEKAAAASKRSKGLNKAVGLDSFDGSSLMSSMMGGKDDQLDYSYVGTFIDNYNNLKSQAIKGSPVYQFLNDKNVVASMAYIKDEGNFRNNKAFNFLGNAFDDAEDPQRAQYVLEVIDRAYKIEQTMPQSVYSSKFPDKESNAQYKSSLNAAYEQSSMLSSTLPDVKQVGSIFDGDFTASDEDVADRILEVQMQAHKARQLKNKRFKNNTYSVQDGRFHGSNTIMLSGNKVIKFDPEDEIIAAKKGGYLNNLFIEESNKYNSFAFSLCEIHDQTVGALVNSNASNTSLSENIIRYDEYADDVSDNEILDLFNSSIDLVKENSKRKIIASNVEVQVV